MPSPLNWVYLVYAVFAAALTVLNVRDSLRIRERADVFFLLSRAGTLVLTVGTFFDDRLVGVGLRWSSDRRRAWALSEGKTDMDFKRVRAHARVCARPHVLVCAHVRVSG